MLQILYALQKVKIYPLVRVVVLRLVLRLLTLILLLLILIFVLILILLVRPNGLLGKKRREKV